MLNRSAVIVRPMRPFGDWVRPVDYEDAPEVTLDQGVDAAHWIH